MALHSSFNNFKGKIACGLPIIPFRTNIDGPAKQSFQGNDMDIIDEAFTFFRVNVLFKNYELKGPADKVLVYLFVLLSHMFKSTESIKDEAQARKRLGEILSGPLPLPKEKGNFMSVMLEDGNGLDREAYVQYIKQMRAETVQRFLHRFFGDGVVTEDFKFWAGLGRKKFMGMNYASMF